MTAATSQPPVPAVLTPGRLGPVTLRNRVIKAATYEGLAHRGRVTRELRDFHVRYAVGGVGMTTLAFCAVSPEGRTDKHQLHWSEKSLPGLARLVEAVHAEGAAVSAQLGHAGPVAHPKVNRAPALAPSRMVNPAARTVARECTSADIERIVADHAEAVRRAVDCGFDAVEVHLGHNYLLSAFLSPKLNRRHDGYGGSLAHRARFPLEVLRAVREAAGGRLAVLAKVNLEDGVRGGFGLEESIAFVQMVQGEGTVDALEMTAGSSLANPMYLFKGDAPLGDFADVMPQPIRLGVRVAGRLLLKEYPWEPNYLLADAGRVRAATTLPMVALGGITGRPSMDLAMRSGFEFVAIGRELLIQPDLVHRIAADPGAPGRCTHCNRCMPTNFTGTRCVVTHPTTSRGPTWGDPAAYLS